MVGSAMLVGGLGWLLQVAGVIDVRWTVIASAVLIVIGLGLVFTSSSGTQWGLVVLGIFMTFILVSATTAQRLPETFGFEFEPSGRVGEVTYHPNSADDHQLAYNIDAGQLTVDLTELEALEGTTVVRAAVGLGQLVVILPEDIPVRVRATVAAGDIHTRGGGISRSGFGRSGNAGVSVDQTFEDPDFDDATTRLDIKLSVGLGEIDVRRRSEPLLPTEAPFPPIEPSPATDESSG